MAVPGLPFPPKFDVWDPAVLDDPYPVYERLRRAGPLCRAGPGVWGVTTHTAIRDMLRDPRIGHDFPEEFRDPFRRFEGEPNSVMPHIVSALEPPQHTRVRKLMAAALSPAEVARRHAVIQTNVQRLLERARQRGHLDAVGDLALPLQVRTACELIGVPAEDQEEVASRGTELGRILILNPFVDPQSGKGVAEAKQLTAYVEDLVTARVRRPADDLVSRLLEVRVGADRLTRQEVVDNVVFLFFAGFETSMHVIGGGAVLLRRFPDQLRLLRRRPQLWPGAVEEILRLDAPIQWVARVVKEDVEVGARRVRAGRALLLLLASGNHDETVWRNAGAMDVTRRPNPHLSFGGGIHHCLGVQLARAQSATALEALVAASPQLEASAPPSPRPHPNLRGYVSVPLEAA